ncbi:hypothetical protein GQ602_003872 [Ophiocordyceps camponoti-floridani]|uniref:Heme haloperoxidase family profile domain-containing protein n=1 Tax=Ophiocordyceps camponoti-floridani TaxID=2030778 RepID=A0A8H4Q5Q1_9HYPO|nr:hypothetical protein GQ602_003872 [Ophiocordyceps camponoti-floridani]
MKAALLASLIASAASTGSAAVPRRNATSGAERDISYGPNVFVPQNNQRVSLPHRHGERLISYGPNNFVSSIFKSKTHRSPGAQVRAYKDDGNNEEGKSQHCVLRLVFQIPYIGDKLQTGGNDKPVESKKECWWIKKPANGKKPKGEAGSTYGKKEPKIDPNDPRFGNFVPRGEGDSRSSCPGLNALANHGFIPHNGKDLTMTTLIVGCYEGLGISPETSALITADGMSEAGIPFDTVFNLERVHSQQWGIEHDVSFGRNDSGHGDLTLLDKASWDLTLKVLDGCGYGDVPCWGKAKVARIEQEKTRFPGSDYSKEAAAYGASEVGMLFGAFDPAIKKDNMKKCVKSLFEEEKIEMECKPDRMGADFEVVTATGVALLASDPVLQKGSDGMVTTAQDILAATGKGKIDLEKVVEVLRAAGFTEKKPYENMERLIAADKKIKANKDQKNGDHN